jgi:hypothetical protein
LSALDIPDPADDFAHPAYDLIGDVAKLIDDLTKPMFVFRFAKGRDVPDASERIHKGAVTSMRKSSLEIHRIVMAYCAASDANVDSEPESPDPDQVYDRIKDRELEVD